MSRVTEVMAGMVTFCLVALPTCITVSSWNTPWGVAITMPVTFLGFAVSRIVMRSVHDRLLHQRRLAQGRALVAEMDTEMGPVTEAELEALRKEWPR